MKKNRLLAFILSAAMLLGMSACTPGAKQADSDNKESSVSDIATGAFDLDGEVITYFANWNLNEKPAAEGGEVASIPWDNVTYINHAFWEVVPTEEPDVTSFDRRAAGLEARTDFYIESTSPELDYGDTEPSAVDPSMQRNHFAEYAAYSEKYPDVNILISIGGWSRCGYFSEMAYTEEGRTSFVNSCLDLIEQYPWIDGIDIDWEYPGGSNDGERLPEDDSEQGCPIWGSPAEDSINFASLCQQLRNELDAKYGEGTKKLTACASASTGWTLPNQNWVIIEPYLDYINIMTYDLAGLWDGVTGFGTSYYGATGALIYFKDKGIDTRKLNIGTPFYGTVFEIDGEINKDKVIGAKITDRAVPGDLFTQKQFREFESEAVSGYKTTVENGWISISEAFDNGGKGWHFGFSDKKLSCYMYNDDESSPYYKLFISYENQLSLQHKLEAVRKFNAGGIIIWESSEDTSDYELTRYLGANLIKK